MTQYQSRASIPDPAENHPAEFQQWRTAFLKQHDELCARREPEGVVYRYAELDHTRAQDDQRTVEATLSAGSPVFRGWHNERLLMTPEAIDLSRGEEMGGYPLLYMHNQEQHLGMAENVRLHDGKLRARLKFTRSKLADQVWASIKDGTLRGISIGYSNQTYSLDETVDPPLMTVERWMPFEVSVVTIPADVHAQVNRAMDLGLYTRAPDQVAFLKAKRDVLRQIDLLALSAQPDSDEVDTRAVDEAVEAARQAFMSAATAADLQNVQRAIDAAQDELQKAEQATESTTLRTNFFGSESPMSDFSLTRALSARIDPQAAARAVHELQLSDEISKRSDIIPRGIMMPGEAIFSRAFNYATEGTDLVSKDHLSSLYVQGLRANLVAGELGVQFLDGLRGNVQIPKATGDVSTYWIAGDGGDTITESEPTVGKIEMSPHFVGGRTIISRRMLLQSDPAADQIVRESLSAMLTQAVDNAILNGTGLNSQPSGVLAQATTNTDTYALDGAPTFGDLVDMEGAINTANAGRGRMAYLMHPGVASVLKKTDIGTDTGQMIWTSTAPGMGMVNGFRAYTSTLVPEGTIILGDWSQVLVGIWGGVDVIVDEATRSAYLDVIITSYTSIDVAVKHEQAFAVLSEAES